MDIIEWVFKKRPWERHLQEVASLKDSIKPEIRLFNELWVAHKKKLEVLKAVDQEGKVDRLREIPKLNNTILNCYKEILSSSDNFRSLIRKILYESTERLSEIQGWVWKYGSEKAPTIDEQQGRRTPYNIETSKRAVLRIVQDEDKLKELVARTEQELQPEINSLYASYAQLNKFLQQQSSNAKQGIWTGFGTDIHETEWSRENNVIADIRRILGDIVNKTMIIAKQIADINIEEQQIHESFPEVERGLSKKVGIMLIHGITCKPSDMAEYENFLRSKGYITYNIRLPGHGESMEEFFNTPIDEIEDFLISAFKYFYLYMKKVNNGDGRFYVAGVSIGSMMPLHIFAKSWQGKYPYQSMVNGLISMSACIIPTALAGVPQFEPVLTKIGPTLFRIVSFFKKTGYYKSFSDIDQKVMQIRKRKLDTEKFYEAIRTEIGSMMRAKLQEQRKQMVIAGGQYLYKDEEEGKLVADIIEMIIKNIEQGKSALDSGDIKSINTRIFRDSMQGHSYKALGALAQLTMQLRQDVKQIQIPILVLQGVKDIVSHYSSAEYIIKNVKTKLQYKSLVFLPKSGHIPVIDFDKQTVFDETVKFVEMIEKNNIGPAENIAA